jgi:CarD family transcriptional regulator
MSGQFQFKAGDKVVYPAHGVGQIIGQETQEIAGKKIVVYVISFLKEKMILRVPVVRAEVSGLRGLSTAKLVEKAVLILKGRARPGRGMWSRRAQEYESKINSGDMISIAEVVRDLHKNVDDPDRSYSERIIYESALGRLAGEMAAVESITIEDATRKLETVLKLRRPANSNRKVKGAEADADFAVVDDVEEFEAA